MESLKVIANIETIQTFYTEVFAGNVIDNSAIYVALCSRNKYGGTSGDSYIDRRIVRVDSVDKFISILHRMEVPVDAYEGVNIDSTVCYVKLNPSDLIKATFNLSRYFMDEIANQRSLNEIPFHRVDLKLMSEIQKSSIKGSKWMDIDIDINHTFCTDNALIQLMSEYDDKITYHIIKTRGGFHVIVDKTTLKFNPNDIIVNLKNILKETFSEIIINNQHTIPCPGTYQGGFEVKLIKTNKV